MQIIKGQVDRDARLADLGNLMKDSYIFVEDIKSLPDKIPSLQGTICNLLSQTVECTMFLRECSGHGFGGMIISILLVPNLQYCRHRKVVVQCMGGPPHQPIHGQLHCAQAVFGDRYFDANSTCLFSRRRDRQQTTSGASIFV
jgi:hypothetical protein